MFEYFPDNYAWSLAVMMADCCGGELGEIDDACRPLRAIASVKGEASSRAWSESWLQVAERVAAQAAEDARAGRAFSAGRKHRRAATYFMMAERQMRHTDPQRMEVYRRMLDAFGAWQATEEHPVERVAVPYEGTTLPALFVPAGPPGGPCMVMFDGFDIMKETICLMNIHADFRRRRISMLVVDHPGVGEALRLQGLKGMPETERPARASLEYLLARGDVDPQRIGIIAPSAGGYHAVRSAALEPRFACCVAWTGVWNWGALFEKRLNGQLAQAVHFHLEHAEWVYGAQGVEDVVRRMEPMRLDGIADRIRCPLLITHGGNDRQTPVSEARQVYEAAVHSARRELRVFTPQEGGCEHCHVDNQTLGTDYMADWVAQVLGGTLGPEGIRSEQAEKESSMSHSIHPTRRAVLRATAAGAAVAAVPGWAQADYPNRPIKLLVPFAPGGGTDVTARMVAERLRVELGQPVVVDNRPGATGTIGTLAAKTAPADGYTLLFTTSTNQVIAPLLMDKPPYDGAHDFTPVTLLIRYLGVLLVSNSVPARNFQEFVAYARARPGKLNYASSGIGSTNHLLGELFKQRTGLHLVHIPYKGSAAGVQALAADEVQVFFDTVPSAQNWMRQGKVKVLAVASDTRSGLLPDVPTLVELKVFEGPADYWMGLMAPPGTPAAIVSRVREACVKMMAGPEMKEFALKGGGEIGVGPSSQFAGLLVDEQRRWGEVIRANKIRAE